VDFPRLDIRDRTGLARQFAAAMERLGPFEPRPRLAIAVSGGADSMSLALLASDWARQRGGDVLGLIVDHGLRTESATEAGLVVRCLATWAIPCVQLKLGDLRRGPALAERAREARYRTLLDACASRGIVHLLVGHHRADQAETLMLRVLSSSSGRGLAGMAALTETSSVRLLRPLLDFPPAALRAFLRENWVDWVEDPSNRDPAATRVRLRATHDDPAGTGDGTLALAHAARAAGMHRTERDRVVAAILSKRASLHPEGYAVITPGPIEPEALGALLRVITGAPYQPAIERIAELSRHPRPITIGGVRVLPAGRMGAGWLLAREPRAIGESVEARPGAEWDRRFRVVRSPPDCDHCRAMIGALGGDSSRFRGCTALPAAVLRTLPAVRIGEKLIAVPHIGIGDSRWRLLFDPRNPAAGAPFLHA